MVKNKYNINKEFLKLNAISLPFNKNLFSIENALLSSMYKNTKMDKDITVKKEIITGYKEEQIQIEIYEPLNASNNAPCLVYFHGGAFVYQKTYIHKILLSYYAKHTPCRIVVVDYRLAPKHPFPYGVEDGYSALRWVYNNAKKLNVNPQKIAVGGDSAGGCIAAAAALMNKDRAKMNICLQMLIYPCVDKELKTESIKKYNDTPVFNSKKANLMWKLYLQDGDFRMPAYASPSHAKSYQDLPPAYIETAEFDCFRDEGIDYADKLKAAGVDVELLNTKGTIHCFDILIKNNIVQESLKKRVLALQRSFNLK